MLGDNKHYLVISRLNRIVSEFGIASFSEVMKQLSNNTHLKAKIVDAMTTNETQWFRDTYPFEIMKNTILPEFSKKKLQEIRIWSSASSTGQETYSISMTISEFMMANPGALTNTTKILGTDISSTVLNEASAGKYDELSLGRGLSDDRKNRFFIQKEHHWEVRPEVKNRTSFQELNLMNNYTLLGRFDIIFCRNVLIYFSSEMKSNILNRMAQVLKPGGYLFLGGSETPSNYTDVFAMIRTPFGVLYQLKEGVSKSAF